MSETQTANPALARPRRRVLSGVVVSDKMQKTIVVRVDRRIPHPMYGKIISRSKRYKAHDESGAAHMGDKVEIRECRPLSHDKRFTLVRVLEAAKVLEGSPS